MVYSPSVFNSLTPGFYEVFCCFFCFLLCKKSDFLQCNNKKCFVTVMLWHLWDNSKLHLMTQVDVAYSYSGKSLTVSQSIMRSSRRVIGPISVHVTSWVNAGEIWHISMAEHRITQNAWALNDTKKRTVLLCLGLAGFIVGLWNKTQLFVLHVVLFPVGITRLNSVVNRIKNRLIIHVFPHFSEKENNFFVKRGFGRIMESDKDWGGQSHGRKISIWGLKCKHSQSWNNTFRKTMLVNFGS